MLARQHPLLFSLFLFAIVTLMQAQEAPAPSTSAPAPAAASPAAAETAAPAATSATAPAIKEQATKSKESSAKPVEAAKAKESTQPKSTPAVVQTSSADVSPGAAVETVKPNAGKPPVKEMPISSGWTFLLGLGLLALFVYYFAADKTRVKRIVGSVLSVVVCTLCILLFQKIGMEKGIELQGGISMEIKIQPAAGREVSAETQQQAIKVLSERINALGTADILIAPQGRDGIFLQMPGVEQEKIKEIEATLEKVAHLSFSILHPQSQFLAQQVASGAQVVPGYVALPYSEEKDKDGKTLPTRYGLVKIKRDMEGKYVSRANYYYGDKGDAISVSFTSDGAKIMAPLTRENQGQPLAIILDDVILSSPVIQEPFSEGCSITGHFTREEAMALASALENPLENPIKIEFSNYISPTMGATAIRHGTLSGIFGLGGILIFMLIYYRFAGLVAIVGLITCIAIIFGTMALFQFTLTLPGIAGMVLTIGMAVDSNVLIYERLREEMAHGKSLRTAIELGYERAFWSIMDANLTTLFTAIILFYIADGTVKGFAVTLIIGIVATLFAALIVTRVCFSWFISSKFFTKLTFMDFIPKKRIDFLGMAKPWLIGSAILTVISIAVVPLTDPRGVELKGGDAISIRSDVEGLSKEKIESSLKQLNLGAEPIVQEQRAVGSDGIFYLVRSPDGTAGKVQQQMEKEFGISSKEMTISSVGSAVGKSMLFNSVMALLLGMLSILLYVTFRYEFSFALGAIVSLAHDVIVALGVSTLLGQELNLIAIGALLTIAGYSINDTVVIFDRVREELQTRRGELKDVMNFAFNETLGRTIITSATTLFTVVVLMIFGGPGLRSFSIYLFVGMITGVYSSLFIASPIALWWAQKSGTNLRKAVLDSEAGKVESLSQHA